MNVSHLMKFAPQGTYVMCKFASHTADDLHEWAVRHGIPAPLDTDKLHMTVIQSHGNVIRDYEKLNGTVNFVVKPVQLVLWPTSFKSLSGKPEAALVMILSSDDLRNLHHDMCDRGGKHCRDSYTPHTALSYFVPTSTDLTKIHLPTFPLHVGKIIAEPIDLEWINK